jgi:hypothetical protein
MCLRVAITAYLEMHKRHTCQFNIGPDAGIEFHSSYYNLGGPGMPSQYSESLRAGRSENRIPVWARFPASVQACSAANPAPCTADNGSLTPELNPSAQRCLPRFFTGGF